MAGPGVSSSVELGLPGYLPNYKTLYLDTLTEQDLAGHLPTKLRKPKRNVNDPMFSGGSLSTADVEDAYPQRLHKALNRGEHAQETLPKTFKDEPSMRPRQRPQRNGPHFALMVEDIPGTRPRAKDAIARPRDTNPLDPRYKLAKPAAQEPLEDGSLRRSGHDTLDVSDIEGARPKKRDVSAPRSTQLDVHDIEGATSGWQPPYKLVIKKDNDPWVNKFKRRQYRRINDVSDIPGAHPIMPAQYQEKHKKKLTESHERHEAHLHAQQVLQDMQFDRETLERTWTALKQTDKDKAGLIEGSKFKKVLQDSGAGVSSAQVDTLVAGLSDNAGFLNYRMFARVMLKKIPVEEDPPAPRGRSLTKPPKTGTSVPWCSDTRVPSHSGSRPSSAHGSFTNLDASSVRRPRPSSAPPSSRTSNSRASTPRATTPKAGTTPRAGSPQSRSDNPHNAGDNNQTKAVKHQKVATKAGEPGSPVMATAGFEPAPPGTPQAHAQSPKSPYAQPASPISPLLFPAQHYSPQPGSPISPQSQPQSLSPFAQPQSAHSPHFHSPHSPKHHSPFHTHNPHSPSHSSQAHSPSHSPHAHSPAHSSHTHSPPHPNPNPPSQSHPHSSPHPHADPPSPHSPAPPSAARAIADTILPGSPATAASSPHDSHLNSQHPTHSTQNTQPPSPTSPHAHPKSPTHYPRQPTSPNQANTTTNAATSSQPTTSTAPNFSAPANHVATSVGGRFLSTAPASPNTTTGHVPNAMHQPHTTTTVTHSAIHQPSTHPPPDMTEAVNQIRRMVWTVDSPSSATSSAAVTVAAGIGPNKHPMDTPASHSVPSRSTDSEPVLQEEWWPDAVAAPLCSTLDEEPTSPSANTAHGLESEDETHTLRVSPLTAPLKMEVEQQQAGSHPDSATSRQSPQVPVPPNALKHQKMKQNLMEDIYGQSAALDQIRASLQKAGEMRAGLVQPTTSKEDGEMFLRLLHGRDEREQRDQLWTAVSSEGKPIVTTWGLPHPPTPTIPPHANTFASLLQSPHSNPTSPITPSPSSPFPPHSSGVSPPGVDGPMSPNPSGTVSLLRRYPSTVASAEMPVAGSPTRRPAAVTGDVPMGFGSSGWPPEPVASRPQRRPKETVEELSGNAHLAGHLSLPGVTNVPGVYNLSGSMPLSSMDDDVEALQSRRHFSNGGQVVHGASVVQLPNAPTSVDDGGQVVPLVTTVDIGGKLVPGVRLVDHNGKIAPPLMSVDGGKKVVLPLKSGKLQSTRKPMLSRLRNSLAAMARGIRSFKPGCAVKTEDGSPRSEE